MHLDEKSHLEDRIEREKNKVEKCKRSNNNSIDRKKSKSKKQELQDFLLQHQNLKAKFSELKAALEDSLESNPEEDYDDTID